jgi:hypothetical protein
MIGGMLPLALGLGESGGTRAPMGRAIIGGIITSTLLTGRSRSFIRISRVGERWKAQRLARRAAPANSGAGD